MDIREPLWWPEHNLLEARLRAASPECEYGAHDSVCPGLEAIGRPVAKPKRERLTIVWILGLVLLALDL